MNEGKTMPECANRPERAEFDELLANLQEEIENLGETSENIIDRIYRLKDVREAKPENCEKEVTTNDLTGSLRACIRRLANYNSRLREAKDDFAKLI